MSLPTENPSTRPETDEDSLAEESAQTHRFTARLLKISRVLLVSSLMLVMIAIGWFATDFATSAPEPSEPEIVASVGKQFSDQIAQILAGRSTRLHFADLPIRDEMLGELPMERLRKASEEAAERKRQAHEKYPREVSGTPNEKALRHIDAGEALPPEPLPRVDTVLVDQGVVTDDGLAKIAELPDLAHLRLRLSPITDDGVGVLASCEKLWLLNLPHSRLTTRGVSKLQDFPRLKQLRLGSPELKNECCRAIAKIRSLRGLHLIGVPVTDEGLKLLTTLPHLESLYLDDSAVTDSGWLWLFRNHSHLHVHVNQRHHDRDPHAHQHEAGM